MQLAANYLMADSKKTSRKRKVEDFVAARRIKTTNKRFPVTAYLLESELDLVDQARKLYRQSRSSFVADCILDRSNEILRLHNRSLSARDLEDEPGKRR
mgnify:CR=1 FL=1